jgi:DNA-binding response OmpR family regulator
MLTAKKDLETKSEAFESGADDYLTKPFEMKELLLRIKSLLKRSGAKTEPSRGVLKFSDLKLDLGTCKAQRKDREVKLTRKEFELLKYLLQNKTLVLRRDDILENVWGYRHESLTNTIETHIRFLRKKIDDGFRPKLIHTVHGIGYKLDEEA